MWVKKGVHRFLGFVTYLSKFIPNLSEVDAPLRQLLKRDVEFAWQPVQQQAFEKLRELCTHPPVLKYFDPAKPVVIFSDASSSGLGAVLLQDDQPVAFSSRSLTEAETRYAHIEKETLSIVKPAPSSTTTYLEHMSRYTTITNLLKTSSKNPCCPHQCGSRGCVFACSGMIQV